jgi:hypothetical protein
MSLRASLARLERVAGTPPPPPPEPRDVFWDRIVREEVPRMTSEQSYWLYRWLCWRIRDQPPGYDPPPWVNEFLTGLGLRPFDLGGVATVGGPVPGETDPAAAE